ncbi:helix-turn-helix domain-containing protein [Paenibacillus sp. MMS18-CY102]|uniref:helix-turn-helix domain-containing protein n=1 Tax=Paenibacillus sp. MMS18-CY102 TaxID=2682849 RepID=UPI0013655BFA|nr:helix-turn-helix transcriptional regulator [Paenibacillus sp. MMS18-CY102]MWC29191.1 helix-turn-helix domain-containing protein [Paenibacillus sp. MMS18-CY102]
MDKFNSVRAAKCREDLNLTLSYIANQLSISIKELSEIESGNLLPSGDTIEQMVKIYGCSKQHLISDTLEPQAVILARNGEKLSKFDQDQVFGFLAFQREISKQIHNEH